MLHLIVLSPLEQTIVAEALRGVHVQPFSQLGGILHTLSAPEKTLQYFKLSTDHVESINDAIVTMISSSIRPGMVILPEREGWHDAICHLETIIARTTGKYPRMGN